MAENEKVVESTGETKPSGNAKFKEWLRKKIVSLKRSPQMIALVFLLASTVFFMLGLYVISQAVYKVFSESTTKATGICTFITTLLSLLVLVSFLNAFPKRKKPNIMFIVLVYLMIAGMIVCDIVYYVQMSNCLATSTGENYRLVNAAQPFAIVHIVLLGISAIVFALLPVYSKLINKIDTSVKLESATENMKQIDIQED